MNPPGWPPRACLGVFPTPLDRAPAGLARLLGTAADTSLWLKRDDLTGFSWGGNKVRTAEFLLGDALARGADVVLVCGGPSSNFAAIMAGAAASAGLEVHHIAYGHEPEDWPASLVASVAAGSRLHFTGSPDRSVMESMAEALAADMRAAGRVPYVVPRGGATPVGAAGFALAAREFATQATDAGLSAPLVVLAVGSGGSLAGLLAGSSALPAGTAIIGVSVSRDPADLETQLVHKAAQAAVLTGSDHPGPDGRFGTRWELVDGRGAGFGVTAGAEAELTAAIHHSTGLLIDATYNAKALAWMASDAGRARLSGAATLVYWYTGGALGCAPTGRRPSATTEMSEEHDDER